MISISKINLRINSLILILLIIFPQILIIIYPQTLILIALLIIIQDLIILLLLLMWIEILLDSIKIITFKINSVITLLSRHNRINLTQLKELLAKANLLKL